MVIAVIQRLTLRSNARMLGIRSAVAALVIGLAPTLHGQPAVDQEVNDDESILLLTIEDAVDLALSRNRSLQSAFLSRESERLSFRLTRNQFEWQTTLISGAQASRALGHIDEELVARDAEISGNLAGAVSRRFSTGAVLTSSLNSSFSRRYDELSNTTGVPDYVQSLALDVSQPLLRGAGRRIAYSPIKQMYLLDLSSKLILKNEVMSLIGQVVNSFNALASAQRQFIIAENALERSQTQRRTNELLIEVGRLARDDIVQSDAEISLREAALVTAENQVALAELALLNVIDVDGLEFEIVEKLDVEPIELTVEQAVSIAQAQQPNFQLFKLAKSLAKIDLEVAENNQLWALDFRAGASLLNRRPRFDDSFKALDQADQLDWRVGLNLEVPINDVGRDVAAQQARISYRRTELDMAESQQRLEIEVTSAVNNVQTAWRQVELAEQSVKLAQRQLEVEGKKLRLGRSSSFNVIALEDALVAAESEEVNSKVDYLSQLIALDAVLGMTLDTWAVRFDDEQAWRNIKE